MLPALVLLALALFAGALLGAPLTGRPAYLHLMLAAGAMPLIFAAMIHFIPVLTRTREAGAGWILFPLLAIAGGMLAAASLAFPAWAWGRNAGALLALSVAAGLLIWSRLRRMRAVGRAHPCLGWYEAALASLALALLLILAASIWPQYWAGFRRLHLHLNTLGFIGMTAVATLAVLMPTAAGRPDPAAGAYLRTNLSWALAGTLLVAAGAAWHGLAGLLGAALWALVLIRLGAGWLRLHGKEIFAWHGAAPALAAALAGLFFSLAMGVLAAVAPARGWPAFDPVAAFVAGFLFPLVTGAATQLLPVWIRPGVQGDWHAGLRQSLGRHAGIRVLLFLAGAMVAGSGKGCGLLLGLSALLWFLFQALYSIAQATFIKGEHAS